MMILARRSAWVPWRITTSACIIERRFAIIPNHGPGTQQQPLIGNYPQAARVLALQAAYRKAEAQKLKENPPNAGQIRNLGLLDKEEDTKKLLGTS